LEFFTVKLLRKSQASREASIPKIGSGLAGNERAVGEIMSKNSIFQLHGEEYSEWNIQKAPEPLEAPVL
jgi:hypothetical protein